MFGPMGFGGELRDPRPVQVSVAALDAVSREDHRVAHVRLPESRWVNRERGRTVPLQLSLIIPLSAASAAHFSGLDRW